MDTKAALLLLTAALATAGCGGADLDWGSDAHGSSVEQALDLTIVAQADTFVQQGSTSTYGSSKTLRMDMSSSQVTEQAYLRFDLGGIGAVSKALLRVYVTNGSSTSAEVFKISSTTWSESTTSWSNRPAVDGPSVGGFGATSTGQWYTVDVTAAITAGTDVLSLALVPRSSNGFDIGSRESNTKPQLVITLAPTTDAGAPPPPAADAGTSTTADAGTSTTADAGTTTTARPKCIDPLTGIARTGSDVVDLNSDIAGRYIGSSPANLCLFGNGHKVDQGRIEPADAYTWTRTQSGDFWEENYHSSDNAVAMRVSYPIVENVAVYNTGNGVVLGDGVQYFAIRDVYIQHAGDDAIESDNLVGGVIDDVLIDKAFSGIAWRMSSSTCAPTPNNVVKISNSIIRVFPQYGIYPGYTSKPIPGYATVFKWEKDCPYATKLELRNTIIVANQDGMASSNLNLNANGHLTVSENNVLVWLGANPYTGVVPPGFTVTNDISVFTNAWQDWFARHPQIQKPSAGPDINYNLPALP